LSVLYTTITAAIACHLQVTVLAVDAEEMCHRIQMRNKVSALKSYAIPESREMFLFSVT
jgi:hypothetical protein